MWAWQLSCGFLAFFCSTHLNVRVPIIWWISCIFQYHSFRCENANYLVYFLHFSVYSFKCKNANYLVDILQFSVELIRIWKCQLSDGFLVFFCCTHLNMSMPNDLWVFLHFLQHSFRCESTNYLMVFLHFSEALNLMWGCQLYGGFLEYFCGTHLNARVPIIW